MKRYELKQQWEKELKRVQMLINKAKKQGIEFEFEPVPKEPKRITEKSINRIKKIDIDSIKKKGKKVEQEPLKVKQKSGKIDIKNKRQSNEDIYIKKGRHPRRKEVIPERKEVTPEQRSEWAKKAAETRKQTTTPEQRSEWAKKAAETRKQKRENELQNTEQITKPEEQKTEQVKPTEEPKQDQYIGVDALTGEVLTEKDITEREQEKKQDEQLKQDTPKKKKTTPYRELFQQRQTERKLLRASLDEGDNILDTLKLELNHAVNEEIADLVLNALEDMESTFDTDQERLTWLKSLAESGEELLDRVYNLIDESDGEKIRASVVSSLIIIYGGYGNIPPETLERAEQLSFEIIGSKFQRKLLRAKKLRSRYQ